eukprot:TRINITY_DN5946_c0_g1_i1.p1 TRINITY_DN5946_c0_g1~~TRINITY_DN5946_c0_g1_i1.p1  ORF type:complete len:302 (+),score=37.84 TRINITY_DN5946_c0_g1_i1:479-1384(+)
MNYTRLSAYLESCSWFEIAEWASRRKLMADRLISSLKLREALGNLLETYMTVRRLLDHSRERSRLITMETDEAKSIIGAILKMFRSITAVLLLMKKKVVINRVCQYFVDEYKQFDDYNFLLIRGQVYLNTKYYVQAEMDLKEVRRKLLEQPASIEREKELDYLDGLLVKLADMEKRRTIEDDAKLIQVPHRRRPKLRPIEAFDGGYNNTNKSNKATKNAITGSRRSSKRQNEILTYNDEDDKNSWTLLGIFSYPLRVSLNLIADYGPCINLSLIHISEPTRLGMISYAVFCLKKKTLISCQ